METKDHFYQYLSDGISFVAPKSSLIRTIYFPLCGTSSDSLKSAVTPFLSGDIKIDKNRYLTHPTATEDLRNDVRNFYLHMDNQGVYSLTQHAFGDDVRIEAGPLWHKVIKKFQGIGLELEVLNFIPVSGEAVELMRISVKNTSDRVLKIHPTAVIPIFGRPLANKHDHEHVSSLFNRVDQISDGVLVLPTMIFNEEGHKPNENVYFVKGFADQQEKPAGSFPTKDIFCGDYGTLTSPESVLRDISPAVFPQEDIQGKEAMGALKFSRVELHPQEKKEYFFVYGIAGNRKEASRNFESFHAAHEFDEALAENKKYWMEKSQSVVFDTGNQDFDSWMRWVSLQPVFRRIFGNSFLPNHDYGKGGRGWRDIWQDLLSLILIEPESIREILINNFAGIRIDGSNATIIGSRSGEFAADRNAITRVWMDHGAWPWLTTQLYIHQTGDYDILLKEVPYFRDSQLSRTLRKDSSWTPLYGNKLKDKRSAVYEGTVIEHILVQSVVQFFNVGEHNIIRLESADWNDGLDMAFNRGESVAFMSFYGWNFLTIADLLEEFAAKRKIKDIAILKELMTLFDSIGRNKINYDRPQLKKKLLFERYFKSVEPTVSGRKIRVKIQHIAEDLRGKGNWIFKHIRKHEKIRIRRNDIPYTWFNGYYDNKGHRVGGKKKDKVRMELTGQVFPIMSGLASDQEVREIMKSSQTFLRDKRWGGYRLNTDFGLPHYLDMGRAFGFAYGTKENGSFFSHMNVMYGFALYKRGFVREGYEVIRSIYQMCTNVERSKIYPGIPEYFDSQGRGMYPYLTGSASWLVLMELTQVFGVRGQAGDLILSPQLVREEFNKEGCAKASCFFAGKRLDVEYINQRGLDYGEYVLQDVFLNNQRLEFSRIDSTEVRIPRKTIEKTTSDCQFRVILD